MIRGTITDEDWARYYQNARRVREFIYPGENGEDKKVANHTKVRLAQLWRAPLLPALRRFVCPEVQAPGLFIQTLFLTPTLLDVEFRFISENEDEAIGSLLCTIADECPALQRLVLGGTLSARSLAYILRLRHLRKLELKHMGPAIDTQLFTEFSALDALEDLTIDLTNSPSSSFTFSTGFLHLTSLNITAPFPITSEILTGLATAGAPIEALTLCAPSGPLLPGWDIQLTALLTKACNAWPTSLHSVTLDHDGPWDHSDLDLMRITPLLHLQQLRALRIQGYNVSTTDAHVGRLAEAWPQLRVLMLPFDGSRSTEPTLAVLERLREMCPALVHLQIPIDVTVIPPVPELSPGPGHGLERLSVVRFNTQPVMRDMLRIARYLDALFPNVRRIENSDGEIVDMWDKVGAMVVAFRDARGSQAGWG